MADTMKNNELFLGSNIQSPCKNCNDRHPACHDRCESYKDFITKRHAITDAFKKEDNSYYLSSSRRYTVAKRTEEVNKKKNRNGHGFIY